MDEADLQSDFSDAFCAFLQSCVGSLDAAELLLVLWRQPASEWSINELATYLVPMANVSEQQVARYVEVFQERGLISRGADARVSYQSTPDFDTQVENLARLYVQRPVTLVRMIDALRDTKIKTFADAFRIWRK
jgi:hypothetical protein